MLKGRMTRRRFLATTAAATAIAMPYVRGAHAAGKLSMGFWDHWVPGANNTTTALVNEWAEKEKVEVSIDYITSVGNKNLLTIAAEAQAKSGHDIFAFPTWEPQAHAKSLEPVDDIMAELIKQNGPVNPTVDYLAQRGRPLARGAGHRRQPDQGAVLAHRSDEEARRHRRGGDVSRRRPAEGRGLDARRHAQGRGSLPEGRASLRHRARHDRGQRRHVGRDLPVLRRQPGRCQGQHHGQDRRRAPGARLLQEARAVPAAGRAGLGQRLQQQVADRRQGRADHEPAERVGGRQARCAADRRAALDPRHAVRSEGTLRTVPALLLGHLELQQEQVGGQEPAGAPVAARVGGEDGGGERRLRSARRSRSFTDFKTWAEEGPPKGTLYHYPNPHNHQILSVGAAPAPPKIAVQIYTQAIQTKMVVRFMQGEPMEKTLAWAESEVEGFMRT